VVTLSGQEEPIRYDSKTGDFIQCTNEQAICKAAFVPEGFYAELSNPAKEANKEHPESEKTGVTSVEMQVGERVNVPGPEMFSLWPGQSVKVIRGHQLGLNEYLLCKVTNEEKARANWSSSIAAAVDGGTDATKTKTPKGIPVPEDLSNGKLFVIKGTDVSFYMPPTGVKVLSEGETDDGKEKYTRDALTLEQLEYCILVDQNGQKRYERGPKVVFPQPTEQFKTDEGGNKKSRAIEMNPISGILVRVIADYKIDKTKEPAPKPLREGFDGEQYKVGDELFITGKDQSLYFPREEHQLVTYDGKAKHFAVAIPEGEARYVLRRLEGKVDTIKGPKMFLPDPRTEVIVRRILTQKQCSLWYPGNTDVAAYNSTLEDLAAKAPSTRPGTVSDGDYERATKGHATGKSITSQASPRSGALMERAMRNDNKGMMAEEVAYSSTFSQPRTLTLNTKLEGVVMVEPFTGNAVMVVGKDGERRVEMGPRTVLLDYDESLEVLELSTGKPKTTDTLYKTVYLTINGNKVSDIIEVETADHVKFQIKLAYRVGFEGDDTKRWFNVSNYIKLLTDHGRSLLKNATRKHGVEAFYKDGFDIVRDTILGKSEKNEDGTKKDRTGMLFTENNMRVTDVEILTLAPMDSTVMQTLVAAQNDAFAASIQLEAEQRKLDVNRKRQEIARAVAEEEAKTAEARAKLDTAATERTLNLALAQLKSNVAQAEQRKLLTDAEQKVENAKFTEDLGRKEKSAAYTEDVAKAELERKLQLIKAETEATEKRFAAASNGFSQTVAQLYDGEMATRIAEAMAPMQFIGGKSLAEVFSKVFGDTKLGDLIRKKATDAPVISANGVQVPTGTQPRA
jgi:major vault protein